MACRLLRCSCYTDILREFSKFGASTGFARKQDITVGKTVYRCILFTWLKWEQRGPSLEQGVLFQGSTSVELWSMSSLD